LCKRTWLSASRHGGRFEKWACLITSRNINWHLTWISEGSHGGKVKMISIREVETVAQVEIEIGTAAAAPHTGAD
jgi:hypothetical protein